MRTEALRATTVAESTAGSGFGAQEVAGRKIHRTR
jgi:hypothetical protein